MSPTQLAAVRRRAVSDVVAHRNGWPVPCPYPANSDEAKEWKAAFDAELKGAS